MLPRENIQVPWTQWFFENGELTELGYEALSLAPDATDIWKLIGLEANDNNLIERLKKSIQYAALDDNILNFLFPHIGSTMFRLGVEKMITGYLIWPGVDQLIEDIEVELGITSPDTPYFYT
jgi:hypothetical protein